MSEKGVWSLFSPQAERVVDTVNPLLHNKIWEGPRGKVLAPEGEALGPPVAWGFG